MNEPKKRGRPTRAGKQAQSTIEIQDRDRETAAIAEITTPIETREVVAYATTRFSEAHESDVTQETVAKVEAEIGRTANAWGMIDPLELIRAVDRVLRGKSHE